MRIGANYNRQVNDESQFFDGLLVQTCCQTVLLLEKSVSR